MTRVLRIDFIATTTPRFYDFNLNRSTEILDNSEPTPDSFSKIVGRDMADFPEMIKLLGGTFRMGSDEHYAEEAPAHRVTVAPFWIDRMPVTNREFRRFVDATGYITYA
jgi:formylglycine-generating enzyme required for sulfatase activity